MTLCRHYSLFCVIFQLGNTRGRKQTEDNGEPILSEVSESENNDDESGDAETEPKSVAEKPPPKAAARGK